MLLLRDTRVIDETYKKKFKKFCFFLFRRHFNMRQVYRKKNCLNTTTHYNKHSGIHTYIHTYIYRVERRYLHGVHKHTPYIGRLYIHLFVPVGV